MIIDSSSDPTDGTASAIGAGIVGLGRSGWNLPAATVAGMPEHHRIAAVTDPDPGRLEEAARAHGCRTRGGFDALLPTPAWCWWWSSAPATSTRSR